LTQVPNCPVAGPYRTFAHFGLSVLHIVGYTDGAGALARGATALGRAVGMGDF
jgi:hypothetical protein